VHGIEHWHHVAQNGEELVAQTPGADEYVVGLFAALHDTQRHSDDQDPEHGPRAALLAKELRGSGLLEATDEQMVLLEHALRFHAGGHTTSDPTIACCWDADRLDLPRLCINPDPDLLSTAAAKACVVPTEDEGEAVFIRFGYPPHDGRS
jgi:uncharacterized protein